MQGDFLKRDNVIAVVGVSSNPEKWGHRIFRKLKSSGFRVFAVNPKGCAIGDDRCFPDLESLEPRPDVVITAVKPDVTEKVVEKCRRLGIKKVWMQPGSESDEAVKFCGENGIEVVYNACFVVGGLKERW